MEIRNTINESALQRKALEYSPNLVEALKAADVVFSTKTYAEIEQIVKNSPGEFVHQPYEPHSSTPENPRIIFEHGASFCSLIFGIDSAGNIASIHKPIVGNEKTRVQEILEDFLTEVNLTLGDDRVFFMTATGAGTQTDERQTLVKHLEEILKKPINYLFVKSEEDDVKKHSLKQLFISTREFLTGIGLLTKRHNYISKVFAVPKYLSTTGKTELIIPYLPGSNGDGRLNDEGLLHAVGVVEQNLLVSE